MIAVRVLRVYIERPQYAAWAGGEYNEHQEKMVREEAHQSLDTACRKIQEAADVLRLRVQIGDRISSYDIDCRRFFMEQHYTLEVE